MTVQINSTLAAWGSSPPVWFRQDLLHRIETICSTVALAAQITPESLFLPRRGPQRVARTRQLVMAILRDGTDLSLQDIGQIFAGRDHGTVIHACKVTRRRCADYPSVKALYQTLTSNPD